jgi:hypothetical protein
LITDCTERPDWLAPLTWSTCGTIGAARRDAGRSLRGRRLAALSDDSETDGAESRLPLDRLIGSMWLARTHLEPEIVPQRRVPDDALLWESQDLEVVVVGRRG